jgi:type VI secretion system secreted protein VgrG
VRHQASFGADYRSGKDEPLTYENDVTCIPAAMPYRPRRTTPKPVVQGSQTAVVVGPSGEEIFTDKYGRVKVQFHWDRDGKNDPSSSCWVRVGTSWAGRQWGAIQIPRIGQEVVVDFLEGDPDQPIIVASVYNADMMPPYTLPANKTQSGVKSRSSLGGKAANYNEFRFEDKMGSEEVLLHAEKDLNVEVENDETRDVGHDRTTTIHHDCTTTVENDRSTTVQGNQTGTDSITGKDAETVQGNQSLTVASSRDKTIASSETITIGSNETLSVGGSLSVTSGAALSVTVGGSTTITSSGAVTISTVGAMSVSAAGTVSVNVGGAATVSVGGAATINAGAAVAVNAGGAIALTGSAVAVTAGAITLTAGVVTCTGVLMATSIMTPTIVSATYSPGVGNMI